MTPLPQCAALALAIALAACSPSDAPAATASPADASAIPTADSVPSPAPDLIAGTGSPTTAAEPATDELAATPGSDAEDTQYFDFSGAALARMRSEARPATPALRDAARRIVDETGRERECGTYPEGERLFVLDLDGRPGDEALLLYTMEGCGGGGNYYDRSGYVLREVDGAWTQVAEFPMGTKLVGNATISALEPGVVVISPDGDSLFEPHRAEIPPR
ncbi:hypothetical protein [Luteimonas sp. MC1895]|uniref:hypothetical protein n=1 Tax=Luteimonas sp. MC1895 TaxID=2819513 RepID=UPI0018F0F580|nr:hypothetical protein [Luteimonas sp. MC1895]MBJ6980270.1 hypothetical protein [Luteimonas sp. MC1895]